jgi:two-component system, NtrC family, nitrogen regulation response regulator NtrX
MASELNMPIKTFRPDALGFLQNLTWSGNVRELKNLMERIYLLCEHATITPEALENSGCVSLPGTKPDDSAFWNNTQPFAEKKREFEKRYLNQQLKLHDNSVSKTAEALSLQQSNLSRKLHELKLL